MAVQAFFPESLLLDPANPVLESLERLATEITEKSRAIAEARVDTEEVLVGHPGFVYRLQIHIPATGHRYDALTCHTEFGSDRVVVSVGGGSGLTVGEERELLDPHKRVEGEPRVTDTARFEDELLRVTSSGLFPSRLRANISLAMSRHQGR